MVRQADDADRMLVQEAIVARESHLDTRLAVLGPSGQSERLGARMAGTRPGTVAMALSVATPVPPDFRVTLSVEATCCQHLLTTIVRKSG